MRIFGSIASSLPFLVALVVGQAPAHGEKQEYEFTIDSKLQIKTQGQLKPQPLDAFTVMRFSVDSSVPGVRVLAVRGLDVRVSSEGNTITESKMSRASASFQQGERKAEPITYEKAPEQLKKLLGHFDTPIARIGVDAEGAETDREILIENSSLVQNGAVENSRLFLVRFPVDKDRWESPAKFSMGEGQFAAGVLSYEKLGEEPDGRIKVGVSGELKADAKIGGGEVRDAVYKIQGEQFYQPSAGCWVAGALSVDISMTMVEDGQPAGSATGTMLLTLKQAGAEVAEPAAEPVDRP